MDTETKERVAAEVRRVFAAAAEKLTPAEWAKAAECNAKLGALQARIAQRRKYGNPIPDSDVDEMVSLTIASIDIGEKMEAAARGCGDCDAPECPDCTSPKSE